MSCRVESEQQELQGELLRQRDKLDRRRKMRVKRERGWTGNSWGGISLGPPDPGPNGGYGLHCHRAVITICKLIGVEDMYAKEEGSVNLLNITMALFTRLANQRPNSFCLVSFSRSAGPCPSSWPPLRMECILTTNPRKRQDMKRMTGHVTLSKMRAV
uniref:28S ribosomal protein S5, mitochondrial-like n=1 Tax=Oncorhynchus gorbuscha TaxID=8017 RepID=UPI001EAE96AA|nr:28S ribosomal protein S5, mitochondrial-like [Oncorhynchus gorbuscha]